MRRRMQNALLNVMERGCLLIDRIPFWIGPLRLLGCPRGLANWAFRLEERWGLAPPPPDTDRPQGNHPGAGR